MQLNSEEIIGLEYQLIDAIKANNTVFLDSVLHEDLLFLAPDGQVVTKEMDLNAHKLKQMTVDELLPTFENCEIIGDTAISVVVYETKGVMLGKSISGCFRYIRIWKVFHDSIKIVSGACLQIS